MTIIAYKDGIVASDSRSTSGSTVMYTNKNKSRIINGYTFWFAGEADVEDELAAWVFDPQKNVEDNADVEALVWDGEDLWWAIKERRRAPTIGLLDKQFSFAMGSGRDLAWGAMDAGASAKEAAEIAAARNIYCGGKIRVKKLW
jgi:ATP-dependent protease HslVU (ClpYQ) peptidase subunit